MISLIISITFILLLLACFVISVLFLYQKKQTTYFEAIEKLKHDYEKNILRTQLEMQEQTFQFISREIHDNISLSLTLAKLNLNTIDWNLLSETKNKINSSLEQISKAITDLSDISKGMNTDLITSQGLIEALKREINRLKKLKLFELEYLVWGNPVFMDSQKELIIFRIIQEALNNVIKHSNATFVKLALEYSTEHIKVLIVDNGSGFCKNTIEQEKKLNAGLINMQRRAALFSGKTSIDSIIGSGTCITITIPY